MDDQSSLAAQPSKVVNFSFTKILWRWAVLESWQGLITMRESWWIDQPSYHSGPEPGQ